MNKMTMIKPDDWHVHLRDTQQMQSVVNFTAKQMGRAVIMPNLTPPITTTKLAIEYKDRIENAVQNSDFLPLMTLYLTDNTDVKEVKLAKDAGIVGFKLYPAGVTTNSGSGVSNITAVYPILLEMQKYQMPLLIHGEVVDKRIDVFDREAVFIDTTLKLIIRDFPELKIVFEHITTKQAIEFVKSCRNNVAATITPQHLLSNRNEMLVDGIHPHYYCLPVLKRETHRLALIDAATSGNPKFFLGTDSAPHSKDDKESSCGCAGCFSAPFAIELYATAFSMVQKIEKLEGFAAIFGAKFYNKPLNSQKITLIRKKFKINKEYNFGEKTLIPYWFNKDIEWEILY